MVKSNSLRLLLSSIKLASIRGQEHLVFKVKDKNTEVLRVLYKAGVIKSYQELPGLVVIQLKTVKKGNSSNAFTSFDHKLSKQKGSISATDLSRLQRREGGSAFYVLTTDLGVVTSFDAITNNIGGRVLFKVT
jgi:ribosomal protein S8